MIRKNLPALILILLCGNLYAARIVVCHSCMITTVQEAVDMANEYDTVEVGAGIFNEFNIEIRKPLTLLGDTTSVIDVDGKGEGLLVFADSVNIIGLTIANVSPSFINDHAAIRLVSVKHVWVRGTRLIGTFFGIYLQESAYCIVSDNTIIGNEGNETTAGNAIHVWKANGIVLSNNRVEGHRDGIYFEFVDNSLISGNESRGNLRYGLHFMFSNDDRYEGNIFERNGAGVAVMFSKRIEMTGNEFINNQGGSSYGLLLKEISDGSLSRNVFRENTVGIYAEGANRLQMVHNEFIRNGKALDIKGNCLDNRIDSNNFLANTFEVYTNSKSNQNSYSGNYWSQYNGYDLDKDGIGDVEYRPVNLFAMVTEQVPAAAFFLHSMLMRILELIEKLFPQMVSETLSDKRPRIKPYPHDTGRAAVQEIRQARSTP